MSGDRDHAHDSAPGTGVEESLRDVLAAPALGASARARHLRRLREHAVTLGAPVRVRWPWLRRGGWLPIPSPGLRWLLDPSPRLSTRFASSAAAGALLGVLATAAVVAAAGGALPGQPAYAAKLLGEQAALTVRGGEDATSYLLRLADRRLDEAEALAAVGAGELVAVAIEGHERRLGQARARAAGDPQGRVQVDEATREAAERLGALAGGGHDAAPPPERAFGDLLPRPAEPGTPEQPGTPPRDAGRPAHAPVPARPDPGDGVPGPQAGPEPDAGPPPPPAGGGPPSTPPGAAQDTRGTPGRPAGGTGEAAPPAPGRGDRGEPGAQGDAGRGADAGHDPSASPRDPRRP